MTANKHGRINQEPSQEAIDGYHDGMRPFWHPVLREEDLPENKPVSVELLGESVVLVRLNREVAAMSNYCCHFQAQLSLGEIVEHGGKQCLQCAYHGWTYDNSGKCIRIPQLPADRKIPPSAKVPGYQTKVKYGLIWVCLVDEPIFDIPEFPEYKAEGYRQAALYEKEALSSSSIRMIMGTLDDTHFPWVHEGILGDRDHPDPPEHKVYREGQYLITTYDIDQPPNIATTDMSKRDESDESLCKITYTDYVGMPNVIRLVKDSDSGRYVIWLATCPHRYNKTSNFWVFARNYDLEPSKDKDYQEFGAKVRAQDKPVIESQRPWIIPPFFTQVELPLGPADLPLMEFQKWLEELKISVAI